MRPCGSFEEDQKNMDIPITLPQSRISPFDLIWCRIDHQKRFGAFVR